MGRRTSGDPNEPVKAYVGKGARVWHMAIYVGEVRVAYDNTGDWWSMYREAASCVPGIRRLVRSGARLPEYRG